MRSLLALDFESLTFGVLLLAFVTMVFALPAALCMLAWSYSGH